MIVLLLSSLPDSWETLVVPVRNATTNEKVTMSQVTNILFSEKKGENLQVQILDKPLLLRTEGEENLSRNNQAVEVIQS